MASVERNDELNRHIVHLKGSDNQDVLMGGNSIISVEVSGGGTVSLGIIGAETPFYATAADASFKCKAPNMNVSLDIGQATVIFDASRM